MSLKNRDNHNRWRNKTVAFRVSPEEDTQIETFVLACHAGYIDGYVLIGGYKAHGEGRVLYSAASSAQTSISPKR